MNQSIVRGLSFVMLWVGVSCVVVAEKTQQNAACRNVPASYSKCTDIGLWMCSAGGGECGGSCRTCGGPGGLPAKMCTIPATGTCNYSDLNCGVKNNGNCQNNGSNCYCDGSARDGDCTEKNCG
jgi:hypothetical protein